MAKKAKKYVLSRGRLSARLDEIQQKLTDLDLNETTPNDLDSFLSELSSDLGDLAAEAEEQA